MSKPKKATRKRGTVTARRFFDLVVLVLGERTGFVAKAPVPMAEVQAEVMRRADLTDAERKAHDEKYIKRRIEFAFRNRRAKYCGSMEPLTVLVNDQGGQWGLTEAGVKRAQELSSGDELPPEAGEESDPEESDPEESDPEESDPEDEKKPARTLSEALSRR